MDDKTRVRCKVCWSELDEEYIEHYLETDYPESDYIGHCPVCWEKDIAAISIIDPEAIKRRIAEDIDQLAYEFGISNQQRLMIKRAILADEPKDMPKCTRPLDMECHAHSGDNCYNGFQCDPISAEPKDREGLLYKSDVDDRG